MSTAQPLAVITPAALSVLLQVPLSRIHAALRAIGSRPALVINGLEHFPESDVVDQVREWLNRGVGQRRRFET